ncbi:MAG: hypothetical protein AAGD07_17660, partial [Planctomycetota bacterium]
MRSSTLCSKAGLLTAILVMLVVAPTTCSEETTQKRTQTVRVSGLWETGFGPVRIAETGDRIVGAYLSGGHVVYFDASRDENQLAFTYEEPNGTLGEAQFDFNRAGNRFTGQYREKGTKRWSSWNGSRVHAKPDRTWLIVLEANWERRLEDRQYAFGEMLEPYFK